MPKFEVTITRTIQRTETHVINITKGQVVDEMGLIGEDKREWRDSVEDYVLEQGEDMFDREPDSVDEDDFTGFDVDSVTEL